MTILKNVRGTQDTIPVLEINKTTIYKRYNIHRVENEDGNQEWEYDEKQLTIEEYMRDSVPITEDTIADISILFEEYQQQTDSAIAELSSLIGGITNV